MSRTYPDQTKWPPAALAAFTAALAFMLPPDEMVLDLGVQSEEINSGLCQRGFQVVTFDSSAQCLDKLQGIPTEMPFPTGRFASLLMINAFYSIDDWDNLIMELRRVLASSGLLVIGTGEEIATDITNHMEVGWETILRRNEVKILHKREPRSRAAFDARLQDCGAAVETFAICRWSEKYTPRQRLDGITSRFSAKTLNIPISIFARCVKDYERWLKAQYSDLDSPIEVSRECALHQWHFEH